MMNSYIINLRSGAPFNSFKFCISNLTGKEWYDNVYIYNSTDPYPVHITTNYVENYKSYISYELILLTLFFYNKIDFNKYLSKKDISINKLLIDLYETLNYNTNNNFNKLQMIVDIGAHHGYYTLNYASIANNVIAIEPYIKNFNILKNNIKINEFNNIKLFNYFITNESTIKQFNVNDKIKFCDDDFIETSCNCKTLDNLIEEINVFNPLIKIDTEGEEVKILQKSTDIIKKLKPNFLIEMHDFCRDDHNLIKNIILFDDYEIVKINKMHCYPEICTVDDDFSKIGYLFCRAKL